MGNLEDPLELRYWRFDDHRVGKGKRVNYYLSNLKDKQRSSPIIHLQSMAYMLSQDLTKGVTEIIVYRSLEDTVKNIRKKPHLKITRNNVEVFGASSDQDDLVLLRDLVDKRLKKKS